MMDKSDWNRVRQFGLPCQPDGVKPRCGHAALRGAWRTLGPSQQIRGNFQKKFEPVKAQKFRLNILAAAKGPAIAEVEHQ